MGTTWKGSKKTFEEDVGAATEPGAAPNDDADDAGASDQTTVAAPECAGVSRALMCSDTAGSCAALQCGSAATRSRSMSSERPTRGPCHVDHEPRSQLALDISTRAPLSPCAHLGHDGTRRADPAPSFLAVVKRRLERAKRGKLRRCKLENHLRKVTGLNSETVSKRLQKRVDSGKFLEVDGCIMRAPKWNNLV